MPEDDGAERPHAEARSERREAREERRRLVPMREEEPAEEDREAPVEIKVVPLEERPERRREDDPRSVDESIGATLLGESPPVTVKCDIHDPLLRRRRRNLD